MLSIRLAENIEQRLQHLSKRTGRTKTYYIREAIISYLEDMEDYYLADERATNPTRIWSFEEVLNNEDLKENL